MSSAAPVSSATTQLVYSWAAAAVHQLYSCTLDTSAGCWRWPPSVPLVTLCGRTLVDTDGPTRTTVSDFVSIQTLIRHPHHLLHTTQPLFTPKTPLKAPYISVRVYRFPLPVCGVWPGRCHITRHPHGLAAAAWRRGPAQTTDTQGQPGQCSFLRPVNKTSGNFTSPN